MTGRVELNASQPGMPRCMAREGGLLLDRPGVASDSVGATLIPREGPPITALKAFFLGRVT